MDDRDETPDELYVSVTGLRLRSPRHLPRFWWHAVRSKLQAQAAEGNLGVATRTVGGVQHTLSTWSSRADMRRYLAAGAHREAMRTFDRIATGSAVGFTAAHEPSWGDALARLARDGHVIGAAGRAARRQPDRSSDPT